MNGQALQKTLSANDVGLTGSHQAGVHVPRALAHVFPPLDAHLSNPREWIQVVDERGTKWDWCWIYYNSRLHKRGTRDEYRLTRITGFLRSVGAAEGQILQLRSLDRPGRYEARILDRPAKEVLALSTSGTWKAVRIAR
jgi:hypothetical protein